MNAEPKPPSSAIGDTITWLGWIAAAIGPIAAVISIAASTVPDASSPAIGVAMGVGILFAGLLMVGFGTAINKLAAIEYHLRSR